MALKKGEITELEIESAAFKGKGVAKKDGLAVFIPNTAPGDLVKARIVKKKKKYREAKLLEIIEPSPKRIEPKCRHALVCGGCTWQFLPYSEQLVIKEQQVRDHVERIAGLSPGIVEPIVGCDQPFYYRNKMEYSFGSRRWLSDEEIRSDDYVDDSAFAAGLHAPGRYDKILNLKECHLQPEFSYKILDFVRSWCISNDIKPFDTYNNEGFIRHLVIRNSHFTEDLMVNIVTFRDEPDIVNRLCSGLIESFPEITTVINNINDQLNPTAVGRYEHVLYGPGYITDNIGHHSFKIDANAFFQTNTKQAEKLYRVAKEYAELSDDELLYDLYCGVGTLTLYLSDQVERAVGVELIDVAIKNAKSNAEDNSVSNTEFVLGDMKDTFNDHMLNKFGKPDCIITDPPRSGMHPDVVSRLGELAVPKLVYVSCNPSTMARDLKELKEHYRVEKVQPVDMFPQTYHIEAVARLTAID
ncbi:MAG TPA: 23S rRNA (uracil(1939)-C(5))-methyltransferase RlmD [Balneolaceae bacterium]|nr:23S rRNA (uracil(1939)-C(5))-methyltransferase RlmD [Balneolaceae bacterium]